MISKKFYRDVNEMLTILVKLFEEFDVDYSRKKVQNFDSYQYSSIEETEIQAKLRDLRVRFYLNYNEISENPDGELHRNFLHELYSTGDELTQKFMSSQNMKF